MAIQQLNKAHYLSTFAEPMRLLKENETPPKCISLKDYVEECIPAHDLPTTTDDIEIHYEYVSGNQKYTHVMFFYGKPNEYLVVIIDNIEERVEGHYLLDLNAEYGVR